MALAIPISDQPKSPFLRTVYTPDFRLPKPHQQTLRDIARGLPETNAGLMTRYLQEQTDTHLIDLNLAQSHQEEDGIFLFDVEYYCHRFKVWESPKSGFHSWLDKIRRARSTLTTLSLRSHQHQVAILHLAYGYPDPMTRHFPKQAQDAFTPDLLNLVRYTDVTEQRRQQVISLASALRYTANCEQPSKGMRMATRNLTTPLSAKPELEQLYAYYDNSISSATALTDALKSFPERVPKQGDIRGESDSEFQRRRQGWLTRRTRHNQRRTKFILQAKKEASVLLTQASVLYHQTWLTQRY